MLVRFAHYAGKDESAERLSVPLAERLESL
jgi:hypothetical protein